MFIVFDVVFCLYVCFSVFFFFFKQKTAYEMRISDWSSDVCSSDLFELGLLDHLAEPQRPGVGGRARRRGEGDRPVKLARDLQGGNRLLQGVDDDDALAHDQTIAIKSGAGRPRFSFKAPGGQPRGCQKIVRASCRERVCQYW